MRDHRVRLSGRKEGTTMTKKTNQNECLCQTTTCGCAANPARCTCGNACACKGGCTCGKGCDCAPAK